MGKAVFFGEGLLLIKILVFALEAVEVGGKSMFFMKNQQTALLLKRVVMSSSSFTIFEIA